MAYDCALIKMFNGKINEDIKEELIVTRDKNTDWKYIKNNGLSGQVIKIRRLSPRGREKVLGCGKHILEIPCFKDGKYFWKNPNKF